MIRHCQSLLALQNRGFEMNIIETQELVPSCHRPEIVESDELQPTCHS
jgi:hypothetical protein